MSAQAASIYTPLSETYVCMEIECSATFAVRQRATPAVRRMACPACGSVTIEPLSRFLGRQQEAS
jgi:DNA-directed RNA polymerase subunit RPC12/RpoP